jgi:hypothetical protein
MTMLKINLQIAFFLEAEVVEAEAVKVEAEGLGVEAESEALKDLPLPHHCLLLYPFSRKMDTS